MRPALTQERLRELLRYDADSGHFHWLPRKGRGGDVRRKDVAGHAHGEGYVRIQVDGRIYLGHRLAWFYVHGSWPAQEIDHINGVPGDNRLCNLREASRDENLQNLRGATRASTTGLLGVSRAGKRYRAEITVRGRSKHLGCFDSPEQAHAAYVAAKRQLHGFGTL